MYSPVFFFFFLFFLQTFEKCAGALFSGIMRPNCALDRSTVLCLYVPGFQRQVIKHVKILSEQSKKIKEQKTSNNERSVSRKTGLQLLIFGLFLRK